MVNNRFWHYTCSSAPSEHEVTIPITYCMKFCLKFIDINRLIDTSYSSLVLLITILLPCWCCKLSSWYLSSLFVLFFKPYRSVRDVPSISVHEVSVLSGLSSFVSFLNDSNPGGNEGTCGWRLWYFSIPKIFLS